MIRAYRPFGLILLVLALLALPVFPSFISTAHAAVTVTSTRSGSWSDAATWDAGRAPAAGDIVVIGAGTTVTYNKFADIELTKVLVRGTLYFSRTIPTRLDTGNIIVESGGHLDMGTPTDPIPAAVDAEVRIVTRVGQSCVAGPMFNEADNGIWVFAGGRWNINGWPVRHTWVKLIEDAPAGATILKVRENVADWEIGSRVVVTPTSMGPATAEFEEITITRAYWSTDHSEIVLSAPLKSLHKGSATHAAEVALLSRNVVVTSKYPEYSLLGHTLYMAGSSGSIGYAEFRDLGMLGCLGRYPVHFHMMQESSRGFVLRGASIWRSDNHFMNIHASSGIYMEDVVGYDTTGVGFFIGEPAEGMASLDSVLVHNLAAKVQWRTGGLDGQQRATGYWIEARNSALIDNVASGSWGTSKSDSGFHLAEGGMFVSTSRPLRMIRNEGHSNKSNGFFSWSNAGEVFTILDFKGWRNGNSGIMWGAYTTRFQIHRAKLYENAKASVTSFVIRAHLQDSELSGTSTVPTPNGIVIGGYFAGNNPTTPVKLLRNTFSGHAVDLSQDHTPCAAGTAEELNPLSGKCSANYIVAAGNHFHSPQAIDFGWHRNANSWVDVRTWDGVTPQAITASSFKLTRKDRPRPDADAFYYNPFDAWLNPSSGSVLGAIVGTVNPAQPAQAVAALGRPARPARALRPGPNPAPAPSPSPAPAGATGTFAPPNISWFAPQEGNLLGALVVLNAAVSGSVPITKVEFYADEQLLTTLTAPPYSVTWSTASWPRRRAYVYACATNLEGLHACTPVVKLVRAGY